MTLASLDRFGRALDRWFQRTDVPIWITEYAYQTSSNAKRGVSARVQAEYAARALELAAKVPRVQLFVWFTFRDEYTNAWRAGLPRRRRPRAPPLQAVRRTGARHRRLTRFGSSV